MKTLYLSLLIVAMSSCGPGAKLRRAKKLIAEAEAKGAIWSKDTVWQELAIFLPETRLDSIIVRVPGDTVVLTKDRLEVKYVRLKGDTVFIEAACLPDTVYQKEPVYITNEITAPKPKWRLIHVIGSALLFFVIGFLLGKILK